MICAILKLEIAVDDQSPLNKLSNKANEVFSAKANDLDSQIRRNIIIYTTVLEFVIGQKNENWGWASIFKDDIEIMIAQSNAHTDFEKPVFTRSF